MPSETFPKEREAFFSWGPKSVREKLANLPEDWESEKRLVKCSILVFLALKADSFLNQDIISIHKS